MLADALKDHIAAEVLELEAGRINFAADLSEMIRQKALPNAPVTAYLIPAGLRPQGGESAAGAYTQAIDEVIACVLVFNSAADVTGARAMPRVDSLMWSVITSVVGWAPPDLDDTPYTSDFRLLRAQVISLTAGAVFLQIEFAIALQLRKFS